MFWKIALLLILLPPLCTGPGLYFLRGLRWRPLEKWCAAIGLSLALLYGSAFLIFLLRLPAWTAWITTGLCLLLTLVCAPQWRSLFAHPVVRRACIGFGVLLVWGLLLLGLVRHYSGGSWFGDWFEHFERSRFFLQQLGPFAPVFGYIPARPPLMNLVAAHFLALVGLDYACFQVIFLFLNLLLFFPLCLMLPALGGARRSVGILVALLMLNPMWQQNVTWTWTKLLTAFYVILGLWFYLAAWRTGDRTRWTAGFLALSAGFLVHFSAGPYLLFLSLHYLFCIFPSRPQRWRELAGIIALCSAFLATWFYWSMDEFGVMPTVASNTTMVEVQKQKLAPSSKLANIGHNLWISFIPHPVHLARSEFDEVFAQPNPWGYWRDYSFLIYQTNFIFGMGSIAGVVVIALLVQRLAHLASTPPSQWRFWVSFVVITALLDIIVHPMRDHYGVAHICGQPLIFLGLAYLAAHFVRLRALVRWLIVLGCALDFALGIFLHFHLENIVFQAAGTANSLSAISAPDNLSAPALDDWLLKERHHLHFLGDYLTSAASAIRFLLIIGSILALGRLTFCDRSVRRSTRLRTGTSKEASPTGG